MSRFIRDRGEGPAEALSTRDTGQTISAANLIRDLAAGPKVNGVILENSGADLAVRVVSIDRTKEQVVFQALHTCLFPALG